MAARSPSLVWVVLTFGTVLSVNSLAGTTTMQTIELMRSLSPYAQGVRTRELGWLNVYRCIAYPLATALVAIYLWPVIAYFRRGAAEPASVVVQRRVVNGPIVMALAGFLPWVFSTIFFPLLTIVRDGSWAPELASQHVLSPLVNGFLAATSGYLIVDWIFRAQVVPHVFPAGRIGAVPGGHPVGVQMRLLVFLMAVAFVPLFTLLGLVQAATARLQGGMAASDVIRDLAHATQATFGVYVLLGIGLTVLLARTLTRPLGDVVSALRQVEGGDLSVGVQVRSGDEVGELEDGVNSMVRALRDRERIFQAFGRVVEPAVRDALLAGGGRRHGERRKVTVLFCDLRGFTSIAEHTTPEEVVQTLNEFFGEMTTWVRQCGGFVDKFIGDAMLVVFGLFEQDGAPLCGAATGLQCALGMRERLAALNTRRSAVGGNPLAMAVSLHTGDVVAGTIGAEDRHDYTVIGDTVNVAARLQQHCKDRGHDLMVSAAVYEAGLTDGVACAIDFRDSVTLRGRTEPVEVYGVSPARGKAAL